MRRNQKNYLRLRYTQYCVKSNSNHKLQLTLYLVPSNSRRNKEKFKSQNVFETGDRVIVVESWILERLELTTMVTLERVSQIVETIHGHKNKEENCTQSDNKFLDLQETLLQASQIINKVANRLEDDWQNLSIEERETCQKLYNDLEPVVQPLITQEAELQKDNTDAAKTLYSALDRLMNTLADAIEFECISSEVSNILSVPFTEDEIKKADTAIARLTAEVNSQEHSPEEIWARFDAVRDRIMSNTKPQN